MFKIKQKHLWTFKRWLELLGYEMKILADGGWTFRGKGTKQNYVRIGKDLTGNTHCQRLYEEFKSYNPFEVA